MFKEIRNKPLRYAVIFIYSVILFFCALELNFLWLFGYSVDINDIRKPNMRIASELYTADSVLIGRYYRENRSPVAFDKIAPSVIHALVATEDVRFYKHSGVDIISLISSGISTASGDKRGGSTITQQLAKNLYRTRYNKSQGLIRHIPLVRTIVFKLKEWSTAFKLESHYSKDEILTLYLNTVPFGNNTYGIKTAAKRFFNREPGMLRTEESATLVGMLKGTTLYNPINNPQDALKRRNVVLSQMRKYDYITDAEFKADTVKPLKVSQGNLENDSQGDSYLRNAVARYLDKWCEENDRDLNEDGLKIYTTIDSRLQGHAEEAVAEQMKLLQRRFDNIWSGQNPWRDSKGVEIPDFIDKTVQRLPVYEYLRKRFAGNADSIGFYLNRKKKMKIFSWGGNKEVEYSTIDSVTYYVKLLNTGMMTLDPFSGKIKVWVGGIDFNYFKYDHVNQSKRQAGSTFKPFAYLAALEAGMSPCDTMIDRPVRIPYQEDGKTEYWEPKNSDWNFSWRPMSLRWAMGKSVNSITAQVTEKVGWDNVVKYAHACGIESPLKSVPSVSLGPNDVSVFEMVKAYGTFLNKGMKTEPILVEKIMDQDGTLLAEFQPKQERAISEEIAWLMLYMFRGGMEEPGGTSQSLWEFPDLWKKGNQIGGKTGTSSDFVDGWYMGITKDLVTGIWVGCDDRSIHFNSSGTGEGAHTALPIFGRFMDKVYKDPKTGITQGPFPKAGVKINRNYYCPTPQYFEPDSTTSDSTAIDSLIIPPGEEPLPEPGTGNNPGAGTRDQGGKQPSSLRKIIADVPGEKRLIGRRLFHLDFM
ncbi:transglycosylase domain-containing protein [Hufsiella ginkgonis]|uniref:Penicillin-binding protein n=1 Tax=Hufsiella ginkgonis TaxID=2695274 RepID=A0A7K1XWX9_9SPHI|nr:transglycosylase domain-containing protein [Hufsiella ginkgonis]MXV15513.1 penicillin-binding protein [Hufsiella ginkgonis]